MVRSCHYQLMVITLTIEQPVYIVDNSPCLNDSSHLHLCVRCWIVKRSAALKQQQTEIETHRSQRWVSKGPNLQETSNASTQVGPAHARKRHLQLSYVLYIRFHTADPRPNVWAWAPEYRSKSSERHSC